MKKTKGSIMLLFAAFFWGTTFVAQTTASDQIGTFTFNGSRSIAESKVKRRTSRKRKYKTDRDWWYPLWLCVVFRNESATEWYRGISGRRGQLRQIGVSHRNVCGYGCNRIRITREEIT